MKPRVVRPPTKVVAFPVAVGCRAVQAQSARAAAVAPRHVGGGTVDCLRRSTIHEHQPRRAHLALLGAPVGALLGDIGPVLLLGSPTFLSVKPEAGERLVH